MTRDDRDRLDPNPGLARLTYVGDGYVLVVQQMFGRFQIQKHLQQDTITVAAETYAMEEETKRLAEQLKAYQKEQKKWT